MSSSERTRQLCATLAEQLRGEAEGDVTAGLSELAQLLSTCAPDDEAEVCAAVETSGVPRELVGALARGLEECQQYLALSALVNLADVGGSELVLRHGGFQLLLGLVNSDEPNTRYYACAGIQNMTSDPFLLSAFVADGADGFPSLEDADATLSARLELDGADEALEHVARCAAGALANLRAVTIASEYVEASDDTEPADDDGQPPPVPPSLGSRRGSLDDKLQKALAARHAYEAHIAEHEEHAARVLQRSLRARRSPRDADAEPAPAADSERAVERARARVRAAAEAAASALRGDRSDLDAYLAGVQPAMLALAKLLADVVGSDDEAHAVECVREAELLCPLLLLLLEHLRAAEERRLAYVELSVLVNLADLGGAHLIDAHGGLELLLGLLRDADPRVCFYAVAGVQNMTASSECAMRVRGTPAERLLEAMLDSGNEPIERCAAGALANIRRASREARETAAAPAAPAAPAAAKPTGDGVRPRADDVRAEPPKEKGGDKAKQRQAKPSTAAAAQQGAGGADAPPPDAPTRGASGVASRGGILDVLFALPASGLGLFILYTLVSLPFSPLFRALVRPAALAAAAPRAKVLRR